MSGWESAVFDKFGRVVMDDPTPEQTELWLRAAEENMKDIMAGKYDYPNPRLDDLEKRISELESFLVL